MRQRADNIISYTVSLFFFPNIQPMRSPFDPAPKRREPLPHADQVDLILIVVSLKVLNPEVTEFGSLQAHGQKG